tara:strand:+ start:1659 stop:1865 length:207 start_codon:yes stop_codon:yes gene_type:complete
MQYETSVVEDFISIDKLINKTELRNSHIRYFWEGLKHSGMGYGEMVEVCRTEFNLSPNLIQRIIARNL